MKNSFFGFRSSSLTRQLVLGGVFSFVSAVSFISQGSAATVEEPWDYHITNSGYGINAYNHVDDGNVNMWDNSFSEGYDDQRWNWYGADNLKLQEGGSFCLNASNRTALANVNIRTCNTGDQDQHWDFVRMSGDYYQIQLKGSNLCLNAHNISQGSNLNIYTCNSSDSEQVFRIYKPLLTPGD